MNTTNLLEQASEHVKKVNKLMGQVEDFETVLNEVNTDDSTVCIYSKKETIFVDGVLNPNIMSGLKVTLLEAIVSQKDKTVAELEQLVCNTQIVVHESDEYKPKKDTIVHKPDFTVELVKELYHEKDMTLEAIAKEFGISRTTLYKFIKDNNLTKPSKKEKETFLDSKVQSKSKKERP